MAEMNKQIERFLIHSRLEKEENLKRILLAEEYGKRHETTRLTKLAEEVNKDLEKKKNKSSQDYFYLSYLNDLLYYLPGAQHHSNTIEHPLIKANDYLDQFYLLGKWRYKSELKGRTKTLKEDEVISVELELLEKLSSHKSIPAIKFYQEILKEGDDGITEEAFNKLKNKYVAQQDSLSIKDNKLIYLYLLNILIRMYFKGNNHLVKNVFELYKVGIKNELLIHNGRISDKTFGNIVITGNTIQEFDYISQFVKEKSSYLKHDQQLDGKTWGIAHLHFSKKEYEKTIDLLWPYKFNSSNFERTGKFLLFQAYFEALRNDHSFLTMFFDFGDALKKYIHRDKDISSDRKKAIYNFIKYTGKIADLFILKEKNKDVFFRTNSKY